MNKTIEELMSVKLIPEILDECRQDSTPEKIAWVLYNNQSPALKMVLAWAMEPTVKFDVEIPKWKPDPNPIGLSPNSLFMEARRLYLFDSRNTTPAKKKTEILLNILESVHPTEAEVLLDVLSKDLKVPGLTANVVNRVFPGLINELSEPSR